MEDIKDSIKTVLSVKNHYEMIDNFARNEYNISFPLINDVIYDGTYHEYDGFDIISENKLKIKYKFGAGDMDYSGSFIVEIDDNSSYNENEWVEFEGNSNKFSEIINKYRNCLVKFDNGHICKFNDPHPFAILTHFKMI